MKKLLTLLAAGVILSSCGKFTTNNNAKTPEQIKADIIKSVPGITKIDAVNKSPVDGLYEVVIGRKVFYATVDGKYLFFGNLVDPVNKKSLTEDKVQQLSKVDVKQLPLELAIKVVNGNGQRQLFVFSDPDCPYCQMFEKQVAAKLTDTTIYTFLFPLPNHPEAKKHSQQILCSKDKAKAWVDFMRDKKALPAETNCKEAANVDKSYKLGTDVVGVEGTPTIILGNGQILSGMLPPEQLLQQMDEAEGKTPPKAAASK
jgi:thiol:disulfide interchange protein DsbC